MYNPLAGDRFCLEHMFALVFPRRRTPRARLPLGDEVVRAQGQDDADDPPASGRCRSYCSPRRRRSSAASVSSSSRSATREGRPSACSTGVMSRRTVWQVSVCTWRPAVARTVESEETTQTRSVARLSVASRSISESAFLAKRTSSGPRTSSCPTPSKTSTPRAPRSATKLASVSRSSRGSAKPPAWSRLCPSKTYRVGSAMSRCQTPNHWCDESVTQFSVRALKPSSHRPVGPGLGVRHWDLVLDTGTCPLPPRLEEEECGRHADVQRLDVAGERDPHHRVARAANERPQPASFCAENEHGAAGEVRLPEPRLRVAGCSVDP